MSQAKVDKYKKDKANRKKTIARQKAGKTIGKIAACLVLAGVLFLIGRGVYNHHEANRERETYYVDLSAVTDYLDTLSAE